MVEESGMAGISVPARIAFWPSYYSPGMAANRPSGRARARPGSLERPINGRLYRGTWLLVGIPLLIAAFSVGKPAALRAAVPSLPPAFDKARAVALARDLSQTFPDRSPGSPGAESARQWFTDQVVKLGLRVHREPFEATIPGRGRVQLENLIVTIPGRSPQALAVLAHLDNIGTGPGASDNASGIAALIELARSYSTSVSGNAPPGASIVSPAHTLLFVATDGGEFGGLGADHFGRVYRDRVVTAIVLDSIAGRATARLVLAGHTAREAAPGLVETAAARIQEQAGAVPRRPSGFAQLLDLAFPFTLYEEGPLLTRGVGAVTVTTAGDSRPAAFSDTPQRLNGGRLAQVGRSAQELLRALDQGAELVQGTSSYVYLGARVIRGWAIQLVLIAALLPFVIATIDLFARCRRRHVPIAPALRSYRSRLAFWLWVGAVFELFAVTRVWPTGAALPLAPHSAAARHWPLLGLLGLGALAALGWVVARARLAPKHPVALDDELAGHTAGLLALGVVSLLVVATNPYALLIVLPSLHAWLWLPQLQSRPFWLRIGVLAAGFLGPVVLLNSFSARYGLGFDAPWYLAELVAVHFVSLPTFVIGLAWLAVAAQFAALATKRYAPYPTADERGLGPIRSAVRSVILAQRGRRRAVADERQRAAGGG
jgi:Peptidase family M28